MNGKIQKNCMIQNWMWISVLSAVAFIVISQMIQSTVVEQSIYQQVAKLRSPTLTKMMIDLTSLGSFSVLILLYVSFMLFFILLRKYTLAFFITVNTAGGILLPHYLKNFFERARPDMSEHLVDVMTHSFPSGHALSSTSIYIGLAYALSRFTQNKHLYFLIHCLAAFIIAVICFSRVYLGVHYFYDVLGGVLMGLSWTSGVVAVFIYRSRAIHSESL